MSTTTATDTITVADEDLVEVGGAEYFRLEAGHPAAEREAIVVRSIETGEITIRAWRDDYVNWWWADPERRTHELLGAYGLDTHAEGAYLYRPEALIEGVRKELERGSEYPDLRWAFEDALDIDASVEYETEHELDDA